VIIQIKECEDLSEEQKQAIEEAVNQAFEEGYERGLHAQVVTAYFEAETNELVH